MQTKFQNLLQKMVSSNQEMASKKKGYNRAAEVISPKKIVDKTVLQNSITSAGDLDLKLGNNNELTWGSEGITLTNTIPRNGIFGEIKITGSGIFTSNSLNQVGGRSWRPAVTPDGINGSSITSGIVNTGLVTLVNTSQPRFFWNNEGLIAYGIGNDGETLYNKFIKYNYNGLDFQLDSVSQLSLTWEGLKIGVQNNLVRINSENGIEVFDDQVIPQRRVQIGEIGVDLFGMQLWNAAGTPTLSTDSDGNLWLQDVLSIGDPNDETDSVGLTSEFNNGDSIRIWAGGDRTIPWGTAGAPTFIIDKNGKVFATDVEIVGGLTGGTIDVESALDSFLNGGDGEIGNILEAILSGGAIPAFSNPVVHLSEILSLTNTTTFTPTSNYHPSTKKYVDDSINSMQASSLAFNW